MITISASASKYLGSYFDKMGSDKFLYVDVVQGGCYGMVYKFLTVNEERLKNSPHEVVSVEDIVLYIDMRAVLFIVGTELDYVETDMGHKLLFRSRSDNNAKEGCGEGRKRGCSNCQCIKSF